MTRARRVLAAAAALVLGSCAGTQPKDVPSSSTTTTVRSPTGGLPTPPTGP